MITTNTTIPLLVFLDSNNICISFYSNFKPVLSTISKQPTGVASTYCGIVQTNDVTPFSAGISTVRIKMGEFIQEIVEADSDNYYLTKTPNETDFKVLKFFDSTPINDPQQGFYFDEEKNAFVPPCPVEGYILDESTFEWKPDPTVGYDLHGDGVLYRYDAENLRWNLVE